MQPFDQIKIQTERLTIRSITEADAPAVFEREGYMHERWIVNGEVCDTVFYGLLRRNYRA